MDGMRQPNQLEFELTLSTDPKGEAPRSAEQGPEPSTTKSEPKSPADTRHLMEEVCERSNLLRALKQVRRNGGSPGVDGMTVKELDAYLRERWPEIRDQLLRSTYVPQPVKRVEIPKPDGGVRKLGVPTALDRFIQQAMLQVLQTRWDRTFSEGSFGFRPGRSAHQAIARAQQHIAAGYRWVVDMDLEKFFDRVNHDILMGRVAKRVKDKRLLKLVRAFLNAGVMESGSVRPTGEGTPQGGPLSPLLSNLVLDELDRELERRGHRFVRYADDCNIFVRSRRAGERVMEGITRFVTEKLKLKVNVSKSAVARPWERKFLGFSFTNHPKPKRRIAPKALERFKERVRSLTRRKRSVGLTRMIEELSRYLKGWRAYFRFTEWRSVLQELDAWIRRRLRCVIWKAWKHRRKRFVELRKRDVNRVLAAKTASSSRGPWRLSQSPALSYALPNAYFAKLGLPSLAPGRPA